MSLRNTLNMVSVRPSVSKVTTFKMFQIDEVKMCGSVCLSVCLTDCLSVCLSVCLLPVCVSLASDFSETIQVTTIILGMVTASDMVMHHVLTILTLTFIQGPTDS